MADATYPLRIIAFEKDAHPLMGIYRPIYRRGDKAYRDEKELHDKEWFAAQVKNGLAVMLKEAIVPPRKPILICLPNANARVLSFLRSQNLEKQDTVVTCVDRPFCHHELWRCIHRVDKQDTKLMRRFYAMMLACHVLQHGETERLDALTTTLYLHPLHQDPTSLNDVWSHARRFLQRFDKSLPEHPMLTTDRLSTAPAA